MHLAALAFLLTGVSGALGAKLVAHPEGFAAGNGPDFDAERLKRPNCWRQTRQESITEQAVIWRHHYKIENMPAAEWQMVASTQKWCEETKKEAQDVIDCEIALHNTIERYCDGGAYLDYACDPRKPELANQQACKTKPSIDAIIFVQRARPGYTGPWPVETSTVTATRTVTEPMLPSDFFNNSRLIPPKTVTRTVTEPMLPSDFFNNSRLIPPKTVTRIVTEPMLPSDFFNNSRLIPPKTVTRIVTEPMLPSDFFNNSRLIPHKTVTRTITREMFLFNNSLSLRPETVTVTSTNNSRASKSWGRFFNTTVTVPTALNVTVTRTPIPTAVFNQTVTIVTTLIKNMTATPTTRWTFPNHTTALPSTFTKTVTVTTNLTLAPFLNSTVAPRTKTVTVTTNLTLAPFLNSTVAPRTKTVTVRPTPGAFGNFTLALPSTFTKTVTVTNFTLAPFLNTTVAPRTKTVTVRPTPGASGNFTLALPSTFTKTVTVTNFTVAPFLNSTVAPRTKTVTMTTSLTLGAFLNSTLSAPTKTVTVTSLTLGSFFNNTISVPTKTVTVTPPYVGNGTAAATGTQLSAALHAVSTLNALVDDLQDKYVPRSAFFSELDGLVRKAKDELPAACNGSRSSRADLERMERLLDSGKGGVMPYLADMVNGGIDESRAEAMKLLRDQRV